MSWLACAAFTFGVLPALVAATGWAGLVKFWLMPWLGYHFWMSTFTVTLDAHQSRRASARVPIVVSMSFA